MKNPATGGSPFSTATRPAPHRHLPAILRNRTASRRAFLQGTAACPGLLMTLSSTALASRSTAPRAEAGVEGWTDETFWDDGSGWV